ncbi:MAG: sulfatase [Phycisphaerae bacterium]|nr:sulfatase [Phycisphaerae bacterium]
MIAREVWETSMRHMDRRALLRSLGVSAVSVGLALGCGPLRTASAAERKPNIIFILVDDLGWAELGCYGNTFNETPNLDAMAKQGMRFTNAYAAAPVCSPTRAALMTGQYPARVGITNYLEARDEKFLSPEYVTLNEALKARGYKTGLIGKWHLTGDYDQKRGEPALHGWDEVICSETSYIAGGKYFHPYFFMKDVKARKEGEYLTDRLNAEAIDFIVRHKSQPFFLYLSHYAVHTALAAKRDMINKYKGKPGAGRRKNNPTLAAMIESVDQGVGGMLAKLKALGIDRHTIVVFTSDNGGEHRVTSNAPLRGGKSELYEGGIRVPLIVRWPGVVSRARVCNAPVSTIDFFPTFLEIAGGGPLPDQPCDGESLVPLLMHSGSLKRKALFWHYPLDKPHFLGGRSSGAVREGDFKLVDFYDTGEMELYDLAADPGEERNLVHTMPGKALVLRQVLRASHGRFAVREQNSGDSR